MCTVCVGVYCCVCVCVLCVCVCVLCVCVCTVCVCVCGCGCGSVGWHVCIGRIKVKRVTGQSLHNRTPQTTILNTACTVI